MLFLAREGDGYSKFHQEDNYSIFVLQDHKDEARSWAWRRVQHYETWGWHSLTTAEFCEVRPEGATG